MGKFNCCNKEIVEPVELVSFLYIKGYGEKFHRVLECNECKEKREIQEYKMLNEYRRYRYRVD